MAYQTTEKQDGGNLFLRIVKNAAIALLALIIIGRIFTSQPGFFQLKEQLSNFAKITKADRQAPIESKYYSRLGNDYMLLHYVRENTPENAVVFLPSKDDFTASLNGQPSAFQGGLVDRLSAIRFLYPRRVVVASDFKNGGTPWAKRMTHVIIVNRRNLDKLPYKVDSTLTMGVLPVNPVSTYK